MGVADLIRTSVSGGSQNSLRAQSDGFGIPAMPTAQRLALSLGVNDAGLSVWDTTSAALYVWTGSAWTGSLVPYSQGLWNANFLCTTGSITLDPANAVGIWTRTGNTVTVSGHFRVLAINAPTGVLNIDNLPFPVITGFESSACVAVDGLNNAARTAVSGAISGTGIQIYHYDSGTLNDIAVHVLAGSDWYISGTYVTA